MARGCAAQIRQATRLEGRAIEIDSWRGIAAMTPNAAPSIPEARRAALTEPRLLAFLPIVYVAWADGDLEAAEIEDIRARLAAFTELPATCRALLSAWLTPEMPPASTELTGLLASLQRAGR
jgi:hypothetical protein